MAFVGIDSGLGGAVGVISQDGEILKYSGFPKIGKDLDLRSTFELFEEIKHQYKPRRVYLEKVHAMPKQGVSSMFTFGKVFGYLEMCLCSLALPYELITPQKWSKTMHNGISKDIPTKERSLMVARRMYPEEKFLLTPRSRKPNDGAIDAILLAEYGRKTFFGGQNETHKKQDP